MLKKSNYTIILFLFFNVFLSAQSMQELQKLKSEYEKIKSQPRGLDSSPNLEIDNSDIKGNLSNEANLNIYSEFESTESSDSLIYFGYDFFTKRDSVSFWENLPALPNYLLGPGDELILSIWGETLIRKSYIISRDGKIYDDKVGLLNMSGKTINEARSYLKNMFGQVYATLNGATPSSYIDISLGQLRSINVNFVGDVKYPGIYPIHPFSTVITGLTQAGGVETTGSLRSISIKRDGKIHAIVDLYSFFIKGSLNNNIQLRDQDIVVVPTRKSIVVVDSSVYKPGIYESIEGETIYDMIDYAGGRDSQASMNIGVRTIANNINDPKNIYSSYYLNFDEAKLANVSSGDKITVLPLFSEEQKVDILGQVKSPGEYYFFRGMTLKDLFKLSSGFEDSSFWKSVYQNQAEIIRRNPNSEYEQVIKFDLSDIVSGSGQNNIYLQNLDKVIIHANINYFEKPPVKILGQVSIPGAYPLINDNETLNSVLQRSGGLTKKALKNGISIFREKKYFTNSIKSSSRNDSLMQFIDKVRVAWHNQDITLMPGDSIFVSEATGTVNITGEVYNPGLIEFRDNKSLRSYINSAGGMTEFGNPKSVIVIYANGVISPKKWYRSPKVENGSTIIINRKADEEPFNVTQFASSWTSILSSMVTVIVLSQQLNNN